MEVGFKREVKGQLRGIYQWGRAFVCGQRDRAAATTTTVISLDLMTFWTSVLAFVELCVFWSYFTGNLLANAVYGHVDEELR